MINTYSLEQINTEIEVYARTDAWTEYRFLAEMSGELLIPCLVRLKGNAENPLLVTFNGAIQRAKAPDGVVFQRSSWLDEIDAHVIQIADPTMCKHPKLQIGWGQFESEQWAIDAYVKLIDCLRKVFGLAPAPKTVFYGSSAGGFQAIAAATLDKGSCALVNNPQLDWSKYLPQFVTYLIRDVFPGKTIEQVIAEQPWRSNVVELWREKGYVPATEIMINMASEQDLRYQLMPSLELLAESEIAGKTPKVSYSVYYDKVIGHNPLSRTFTVKKLNSKLDALR